MSIITISEIVDAFRSLQEKRDQIVERAGKLLEEFKSSHEGKSWSYDQMETAMKAAFDGSIPSNPLARDLSIANTVFIIPEGNEDPIGNHAGWLFFEETGTLLPNGVAEVTIIAATFAAIAQ